jgi:putative ABC transport system permease protein
LYKVKGVIEDVPGNTHLKFKVLLSRLSLATLKPWYTDERWGNNNEYTYILTTPGTDVAALNAKIAGMAASMKGLEEELPVAGPIKEIHLYSDRAYEPEPTGNADIVLYFSVIAVFIIAIAWINYINLSTARSVERAREVGIRKVMGWTSVRRWLLMPISLMFQTPHSTIHNKHSVLNYYARAMLQ